MRALRGMALGAVALVASGWNEADAQIRVPGAPPARPAMTEGVAAIVNDQVISTWDVRQRSALILLSSGIEPSQQALDEVRLQALRSLVDEQLQMQEAKEYKVEVADEEVEGSLEDIARQNETSPQQFLAQLSSAGVNPATLRDQLRAEMAWRRLVGGRFGSRVRISPARIQETIDRIKANAANTQFLISEILLATDTPEEKTQAEATAQRLLSEMAQGAPFPLVARQFSSAPTAAAGGDLGWLSQGEVRAELLPVVQQLRPGQVSRPIVTPAGVYLLALRERREGVDINTVGRVTLLQVSAPISGRANLERAVRAASSCAEAESAAQRVQGVQTLALGDASMGELNPALRDLVAPLPIGRPSAIVTEGENLASYVVCARDSGGAAPSPEEVEDRLYSQEVAMLSQRYLRNLRREATIITPR